MKYWEQEPPTHVLLCLRYLGQQKRSMPTREALKAQMHELGALVGQPVATQPPEGFLDMVEWAERMKSKVVKQSVN